MKSLIFTFIFTFLFIHQIKACDFNQYSGDIRLAIINGHQIYTLFTIHTTEEHINAAMSFTTTRTLNHAINTLHKALEVYQTTIQSEQSDVRQIIELIESEQIDWIAIEASPKELQEVPITDAASEYLDLRDIFNNQFNSTQQWDQSKTHQLLHLLSPTIIIAHAQNPEVFQGIRIVPLESNEQRTQALEKEFQRRNQKDILINLLHNKLITWSQLQPILAFASDRIDNAINSNSNSEIAPILASLQEEARTAVDTYLDQTNELLNLSKQRSQTAAVSISHQTGNGLVIMGSSHASSIETHLTASCETI